ncbi:low temperature requirement protein A [Peterkaempfera griseoplana]|uniref:low temperature requirement protein A n=1 Tax=Peterkaempfera griseoplana TaxID=66896 RepID=UPI0006E1B076|nr:low temperature requirement protein A [Peterkaempfera griseoplana]
MTARDPAEAHRSTTALELLFDLCFVVAVAQAGIRLVHAQTTGHPAHGLAGYLSVFFAIWWAWVNFSWFASAYDCDDVPYRLATLVQICGVLVLAAGVPRAFEHADYGLAVVGYLIMRLVMTGQWLRAAHGETGPARTTALRYAAGLMVIQAGWVVLLLLPAGAWTPGFLLLVVCELSLPGYAEHARRTPWHPHHIAERYGAFTIITLGESVAAATVAVQSAVDETSELAELLPIAAGGLLIVFAAYWIYFAVPIHEHLASNRQSFLWGYGHYLVFGSAAAIGAGIEVAVEQTVGRAHIPATEAAAALTVPTAVFLLSAWLLHARHFKVVLSQQLVLPVSALLVLACTFAGRHAAPLAGLVAAAAVAAGVVLAAGTPEHRTAR